MPLAWGVPNHPSLTLSLQVTSTITYATSVTSVRFLVHPFSQHQHGIMPTLTHHTSPPSAQPAAVSNSACGLLAPASQHSRKHCVCMCVWIGPVVVSDTQFRVVLKPKSRRGSYRFLRLPVRSVSDPSACCLRPLILLAGSVSGSLFCVSVWSFT